MQITDNQLSEISAAMAFAQYFVSDLDRNLTEQAKKTMKSCLTVCAHLLKCTYKGMQND